MTHTAPKNAPILGWLIGPMALLAIGAGLAIVRSGAGWIVGATLGLVLSATLLWVLISALAPSKPDKTCPGCGDESLQRMDPLTTRGVVCGTCGWSDDSVSSFYLAEEDGAPLEAMALAGRTPKARTGSAPNLTP